MPKAYIYMCTCILCLSVKSRLRNHDTSSGFSRTRKLHFGTSCIPSRGLFIDTTTLGSSAKRSVNNTASPPPHQSSAKPGVLRQRRRQVHSPKASSNKNSAISFLQTRASSFVKSDLQFRFIWGKNLGGRGNTKRPYEVNTAALQALAVVGPSACKGPFSFSKVWLQNVAETEVTWFVVFPS